MKYTLAFAIILTLVGCGGSSSPQEQPPPNNPAQGKVLEETCNGTTLVQTIADGNGGTTQNTLLNSKACGYEAPPQFGTPLGTPYCANNTQNMFNNLLAVIQNLRQYDKVQDYADGEGGSYTEVVETDVEDCGYEQVPEEGTLIGDSYCASTVPAAEFDLLSENINHLLPEDRMQDYADGDGGYYVDRTVHLDQTCFVQMQKPDSCPTSATATGDSRYGYITCDGVKQTSDTSFPYQPNHTGRAVIDMLIVFDTNINEEDREGMTIEEFVDHQVYLSNHMYMASGTYTLIRVAGIMLVDVAPGDLYRQYDAFFKGRSEFQGLDQWQRSADADLAFLFKKRPEVPIACGVANLDASRGISKTRGIIQCFHNSVFQEYETTRYYQRANETFAHEIGHLLGAQHHYQDANSPGLFEYSYAHHLEGYDPQVDNEDYVGTHGGYGTIMSYADLPVGRFSDYDVSCTYGDDAGEYAGQSVQLGTRGGCFCLDEPEDQPPPTNNAETIQRTRWTMSQLHEMEHGVQFSEIPGLSILDIEEDPDICLF